MALIPFLAWHVLGVEAEALLVSQERLRGQVLSLRQERLRGQVLRPQESEAEGPSVEPSGSAEGRMGGAFHT